MILWFGVGVIAVALLGMLVCLVAALRKRQPDDITLGATLLVAILLLVQVLIAIASPFAGNTPVGDPLEFWMYLVVALLLPVGAGFWALIDRTRWANIVLGVVLFADAVMTFRMLVIWG